jgi:bifunctional non-homologous end joining protein LigD
VDYLRNQWGASTVAAFSVRARPGLPVSVPIGRDELERIHGAGDWTVLNLLDRLGALQADPWADYANVQRITNDMRERLGIATGG